MRSLLALLFCVSLLGCPKNVPRNYPKPSADELLAHVAGIKDRVTTLNAETMSNSWRGKDRLKNKVFMLAAWGGQLRFLAMAPNDSAAADLASDGQTYCFTDARQNCGECGPATAENVARLTRVVLEPDEIVAALFGSAPVLHNAKVSSHTWNAKKGREILVLSNGRFTQRIELDGRDKRWDVLKSKMTGPDGKTVWSIEHFDFRTIKTVKDGSVRFPKKSQIKQGKTDLGIDWRDVRLNENLDAAKFKMTLDPGLPRCG